MHAIPLPTRHISGFSQGSSEDTGWCCVETGFLLSCLFNFMQAGQVVNASMLVLSWVCVVVAGALGNHPGLEFNQSDSGPGEAA